MSASACPSRVCAAPPRLRPCAARSAALTGGPSARPSALRCSHSARQHARQPQQHAPASQSRRRAARLLRASSRSSGRSSRLSSGSSHTWQPSMMVALACVEHPLASRSLLPLHLPVARGRGGSGATRGGFRSRCRIFAPPRSGGRITPAPSCISGTALLIVAGAKIQGRLGSLVLVAPELVAELELLWIDAQRARRSSRHIADTQAAACASHCDRGYFKRGGAGRKPLKMAVCPSGHAYGPMGAGGSALRIFTPITYA